MATHSVHAKPMRVQTPRDTARRSSDAAHRILLLPALSLAIGLDEVTREETRMLAFDDTSYRRDLALRARSGAFVWEGEILCDAVRETVTYRGVVRRASSADLALLARIS